MEGAPGAGGAGRAGGKGPGGVGHTAPSRATSSSGCCVIWFPESMLVYLGNSESQENAHFIRFVLELIIITVNTSVRRLMRRKKQKGEAVAGTQAVITFLSDDDDDLNR